MATRLHIIQFFWNSLSVTDAWCTLYKERGAKHGIKVMFIFPLVPLLSDWYHCFMATCHAVYTLNIRTVEIPCTCHEHVMHMITNKHERRSCHGEIPCFWTDHGILKMGSNPRLPLIRIWISKRQLHFSIVSVSRNHLLWIVSRKRYKKLSNKASNWAEAKTMHSQLCTLSIWFVQFHEKITWDTYL